MKLKIFRVITALALILWMAFIFMLSHQTAAQSGAVSGGFTEKLFSVFYPYFKSMTDMQKQEIINGASFLIRKAAHFSIYALLGVFSFLTFYSYSKIKKTARLVISFFICFIFAMSDEWHQTFIVGRSGEIRDVLIDSSGALIAIIILFLLLKFTKLGKLKNYIVG